MAVYDNEIWKIHTAGAYFVGWYSTPTIHVIAQHAKLTIAFDMTMEEAINLGKLLHVDCACGCFIHEAFKNREIQVAFNDQGYACRVGNADGSGYIDLTIM